MKIILNEAEAKYHILHSLGLDAKLRRLDNMLVSEHEVEITNGGSRMEESPEQGENMSFPI